MLKINITTAIPAFGERGRSAETSLRIENPSAVIDQGIGFRPEEAELIFSKFFRVSGPGSGSGTGMGLSIAKGIVEAHGGTIRAESIPGKGSIFVCSVPAEQKAQILSI